MNNFEFDKSFAEQYGVVCGVDEAGRGPLAGDVFAAAVILPQDKIIDGIDDSKKLSPKKRDLLYDTIIQTAVCYCIASASVAEIEELNILGAAMLAMKRAICGLEISADIVLVDGNKTPQGLDIPCKCIVKGDSLSASIAAASILAKVSRDRYMLKLAKKYPQYKFEKHKGYGTALHYKMLDEYGVSDVHRPSFLKKYFDKK